MVIIADRVLTGHRMNIIHNSRIKTLGPKDMVIVAERSQAEDCGSSNAGSNPVDHPTPVWSRWSGHMPEEHKDLSSILRTGKQGEGSLGTNSGP